MTYSELLHQVTFDELVPYIPCYFSFPMDDLPWCKTHYDMLRLLEPRKEDSDQPNIIISENKTRGMGKLQAFPLEGELWEVSLAKEIVVEPNIKTTPEEIATCCLWHSSLYGYTKEQQNKTAERLRAYSQNLSDRDIQRIRTQRLKDKLSQHGIHIPSKKTLLTIPSFRKDVKETMMRIQANPLERHQHLRKERWCRHVAIKQEYYRRIGIVGEFVEHCLPTGKCDITPSGTQFIASDNLATVAGNSGVTPEALEKLFLLHHCSKYSYQSYAGDVSQRVNWMLELADKYNAFVLHWNPDNMMISINVSPKHPFTQEEHRLIDRVSKLAKGQVSYWVNNDSQLWEELRLSVMFYE